MAAEDRTVLLGHAEDERVKYETNDQSDDSDQRRRRSNRKPPVKTIYHPANRQTVLEACAGHDDEDEEFELPQMYLDLEAAGWTVDGAYMALRRRCVGVAGSRHRRKVHVTTKMVKTLKSGNFSATNNRMYDGCTAGITPFAVTHLSPKMAHKDEMDHQAFEEATHKTQAKNKKFMAGQ